jgi:hypothetical protein
VHDFWLWKESQIAIDKEIECLANQGYQGIQKLHPLVTFARGRMVKVAEERGREYEKY